jgi:protein-tyrosine phosphatase
VGLADTGLNVTRLQEYPNFRDIGGMNAGSFGRLRHGLVFRAEAVLDPGPGDAALLEVSEIRLVFDLRSSAECIRAPNRFWTGQGAECLNMDLMADLDAASNPWVVMREDTSVQSADKAMLALYRGLPQAALAHAPTLLGRIANGGAPVLVHCTAGKDRTGFMIALLLAALGVPHDTIIEDYLLSAGRKTAAAREATRAMVVSHLGSAMAEDALDTMMGVKPDYLAASLAAIESEFGGMDRYLLQLGVDPQRREALQALLLE